MTVFTIIRNMLSTPAFLLGCVTFIGLLLQKKPKDYIIKGTVTTIIGYTLLSIGSNVLENRVLHDFSVLFDFVFHIQGVIPNMEAITSLGISQYGVLVSEVMFLGMIANLVIARYSSLKYIFLTGHHTLYMACLLVVVFSQSQMMNWQVLIACSLVLGILMALMPHILQKDMQEITHNDKIAYGHFSSIGCLFAGKIAYLVRNKKCVERKQDVEFSVKLSFMKDSTVCIFIVMSVIFILITGMAAAQIDLSELDIEYHADQMQHWILYAITQGAVFSCSIYIILAGVRMMIAEIVPAFKGISKKVVPNGKLAVDCPIVFSYAPNAVMIGFLMSFLGGIVVMLALLGINRLSDVYYLPVIVPGVVSHFFCGGSAGVFANAKGGTRGCVIGSFAHGVLISVLSLLIMPLLGSLSLSGTAFSDSDFCLFGILFGYLMKLIPANGVFLLCVSVFLLLITMNFIKRKLRLKKTSK